MRSTQLQEDSDSAGWITGVIWDVDRRVSVGRAGFHGPPDRTGMVEVGYAVDPAYRGLGCARAALEALLDRAARDPDVTMVRQRPPGQHGVPRAGGAVGLPARG